jgi:hypothetical protein
LFFFFCSWYECSIEAKRNRSKRPARKARITLVSIDLLLVVASNFFDLVRFEIRDSLPSVTHLFVSVAPKKLTHLVVEITLCLVVMDEVASPALAVGVVFIPPRRVVAPPEHMGTVGSRFPASDAHRVAGADIQGEVFVGQLHR